MLGILVLSVIVVFIVGYFTFGRFLVRHIELDDSKPTPAQTINDGIDFVPAKPQLLLGQHFSAIAAAGPIVGPVLACLWFGWLPALLWIILGAIFIGGVHDFFALIASVRHKAASVGEIVKKYMSPLSHKLFLIFIWFALVYVVIAFTDITAQTFKTVSDGSNFGSAVAASSFLYLLLAVIMGFLLRKGADFNITTLCFVPILLFIVWAGPHLPAGLLNGLGAVSVKQWDVILLVYCLVASLVPMWVLLQPRGYLGGWFLYLIIAIGFIGALFGGYHIQYPALNITGLKSIDNGKFLFPILFITVACGACSGFHGVVSSGTTSKQLDKESSALPVGYGAMLLEGIVAVLAMATVMMLPKGDAILKQDPNLVYANGIARYLGLLHIDFSLALTFALLAFSTFVYDTLDVCTRLARYILQELFDWQTRAGALMATVITLLVPLAFLLFSKEKGYLAAWPIFGTSNQLLASLTLLAISVWLKKTNRNHLYALLPACFMLVMTLWSLFTFIAPFISGLLQGGVKSDMWISGACSCVLIVLTAMLLIETRKALR